LPNTGVQNTIDKNQSTKKVFKNIKRCNIIICYLNLCGVWVPECRAWSEERLATPPKFAAAMQHDK
jgi:hypothetical protein